MALDFGAGCIGGAAGIAVGFPLDTVKVRIQTQDPAKGLKYTSTFQCMRSIIKEEGARSMYRGITSPLAGVAAINAICFGVYGNVNRRLKDPESLKSITVAGMASGFVQAFVCSPMELIKTQMQVRPECNKVSDTIKSIVDKAGYRGLTRGLGITICREVPAFGIVFSSYEWMVKMGGGKDNNLLVFTAGGISGIFSWVFTYPIDVIKSRLQADNFGKTAKYHGIMQCLKLSVQSEGWASMMRGMGSTVIRAFPTNAATMGTVTLILKAFSDEEINVYDAMNKVQKLDAFKFDFPPVVENYFEHSIGSKSGRGMAYHHNVSTIATSGCQIFHIARPNFGFSKEKLYVEKMLFAMPSYHDEGKVQVGTIRSGVSISTVIRVLERLLIPKENKNEAEHDELLWNSKKAFMNKTSDFFLDFSDKNGMVVHAQEEKITEEESVIPLPSLLNNKRKSSETDARNEHVGTADLFNTHSLTKSGGDKQILGAYYVLG